MRAIAGRDVTLTLGALSCTAQTDAAGVASCAVSTPSGVSTATFTASFGGDAEYLSASTTQTVTLQIPTRLHYGGGTTADFGDNATLSATLTDSNGAPLAGQQVAFTMGSQTCQGTTDARFVPRHRRRVRDRRLQHDGHRHLLELAVAEAEHVERRQRTGRVQGLRAERVEPLRRRLEYRPGNSSPPPSGPLPTYMGVLVTSSSTKSGSAVSGNTVHVVVVRTDAGYGTNPGHAGTDTVVASAC